jgi:hypothetical protein
MVERKLDALKRLFYVYDVFGEHCEEYTGLIIRHIENINEAMRSRRDTKELFEKLFEMVNNYHTFFPDYIEDIKYTNIFRIIEDIKQSI